MNPLAALILIPVLASFAVAAVRRSALPRNILVFAAVTANLALAVFLYNKNITCVIPWAGFGVTIGFRLDHFSSFVILGTAFFAFFISLYAFVFMRNRPHPTQFFIYVLLSLALTNGALLADNLIALLFFWEGLLITVYGMIAIGNAGAFRSALKSLVVVGVGDLLMMIGMILIGHTAGTFAMSKISMTLAGAGGVAFLFLMLGAFAKAGAMPLHSWIPDAAVDASTPFMALIPASLDKLLGIYFLARISLELFQLDPHSWVSTVLMVMGAVTIIFAVMMALIQSHYNRLLSYHAISQVGYMVLGIGTLVPAGIVGGLFHMINHALYKSCLFLTGGSVERQAGSLDLKKLGGLGPQMPVTFACFIMTAAAISGVPPFNGFFSKELVYEGALQRGLIFYAAAVAGTFLTAASFLKLGHAVYLGRRANGNTAPVKEAPPLMLVSMIVIAVTSLLFGIFNAVPLRQFIQPILGDHWLHGHDFAGMPTNLLLVLGTVITLILALINHLIGVRLGGSALNAANHIRYAPGLKQIYALAEKGRFDPYNIGMAAMAVFARLSHATDRFIDRLTSIYPAAIAAAISRDIRRAHTGSYKVYILWSLTGAAVFVYYLLRKG